MSIQVTDSNISFGYFMSHEGVEDVLLEELEINHGGTTSVQKFMAASAKDDRAKLSQTINNFALCLFLGVVFSVPTMGIFGFTFFTFAAINLARTPFRVNTLYQDYSALQKLPNHSRSPAHA
ncbi:MAG: hypothetical protein S4CHLAM37_10370 [Chlamydiia bacterium]|nr:hypothetical protein [Chlamydiia bacterium]